MADITSTNITFYKNVNFGTTRGKIYQIISDGTGVTAPITPGPGFTIPLGNYSGVTESSGTFTFTLPAGTNLSKRYILFLTE